MLTMQNYSYLVSAGCLMLLATSIIILILYFTNNKYKKIINSVDISIFGQAAFYITLISIAGALIYQEHYNTPVCPMCWQQRMIIYAILIVSLVGTLVKDKMNYIYIGALSLYGIYLASEHYYYHFIKYVLKDELSLPCDATGVACSDSVIGAVFGFVTIPLMSLCVFISILSLSIFAHFKSFQK
jgi:disulfide bond formation protein DsbB